MAKERTSAAFRAFLGGAGAVRDIQERTAKQEESQKDRDLRTQLANNQIAAVRENLLTQIKAANERSKAEMAQARDLHEANLIHREEMNTKTIQAGLKRHNQTIAATKAGQLMNYNANQMRENMSYFETFGVTPPSQWQYDAQGRMLPAGHPSYYANSSNGDGSGSGNPFDRSIETPDPIPVAKEAMTVANFPNEVVNNVNKLVDKIQDTKPTQSFNYGWTALGAGGKPTTVGSSVDYKSRLTGKEAVAELKANEPPAINQSLRSLNDIIKKKKGILNKEDKRRAAKTLQSAGVYYQGMVNLINNPTGDEGIAKFSNELNLSTKVRNQIAKYYSEKLVEVQDMLETYTSALPSYGNKGKTEVLQRP